MDKSQKNYQEKAKEASTIYLINLSTTAIKTINTVTSIVTNTIPKLIDMLDTFNNELSKTSDKIN